MSSKKKTTKSVSKNSSEVTSESPNEKKIKEELQKLITESESISGRDASAIKASSIELEEQIIASSLSSDKKKKLLSKVKQLQQDVDNEDKLEKVCGRVIQVGLLFTSLVPMLLTLFGKISEFTTRPILINPPVDLTQQHAVIIGGCGALGTELALMLASSGSSVILGCRYSSDMSSFDDEENEFDDAVLGATDDSYAVETEQLKARALSRASLRSRLLEEGVWANEGEEGTISKLTPGTVSIWPIDLESLTSVSLFADRVLKEVPKLDLLVHVAATKEGCSLTEDSYELSHQVNFIAPALATQLLLPALGVNLEDKSKHADYKSRIIYTTCDAALQVPDWLPWPMRRIDPIMLPSVKYHRLQPLKRHTTIDYDNHIANKPLPNCEPLSEYANAKLSAVIQAKELARRLNVRTSVVTHIVNPGALDTPFGRSAGPPTIRVSARAKMMAYMPPVWISRKLWGLVSSKVDVSGFMLRDPKVGAQLLFHACTSEGTGDLSHVGGLYADTAGVNINCGKAPWECSRVAASEYPEAVLNRSLATELYGHTDTTIRNHQMRHGAGEEVSGTGGEASGSGQRVEVGERMARGAKDNKRNLIEVEVTDSQHDVEVSAEWD